MKISVNWLKDFVDFDLSPEELAATLTALGLEATAESRKFDFNGVVVGKILQVDAIPGSDHLTLCQVDIGNKVVPIVCGAPNVKSGALVPVAAVGAVLPGGTEIKPTKIRGQVSQGMICAEDELGLSDDHSGIIILDIQAALGQDFKEYLMSSGDSVIDLDLTPNRGDAFSHVGVARDLAAGMGTSVRMPQISFDESATPIEKLAKIDISAPDGCHRYASRVISGIKVGPSPDWMVKRLEAVGLRPINNVVDASNYVLMELGHPLHIFDYDRLAEHRIDVYFAQAGQTFTTLDGQERRLDERHLVIADGNGPVALAGVMGGLESEVTDETTNVLIESAYFDPPVIRRGSKSLGLSTEASKRFERDTDIEGLILALDRVTALIVELAGGAVAKGRIDVYPTVHAPREIDLSVSFTNRLLGTSLSAEVMNEFLTRLEIAAVSKGEDTLQCTVPLNRPELTQPVDLIEEIARMAGYDSIPAVEGVDVRFQALIDDSQAFFSQVRSSLVPWGFHEHMANTLTRQELTGLFSDTGAIELRNPLSTEMAFLRTSLIPGLVQAAAFNERRQQRVVQLFEIGAVHHRDETAYNRTRETFMLGLIATIGAHSGAVHWKKPVPRDQFFLKGVIDRLLQALRVSAVDFTPTDADGLSSALRVSSDGTILGTLGEVSEEVRDLLKLETRAAVAELDLAQIGSCRRGAGTAYRDVVPYPVVERDIAVEVPASVPAADLLDTIRLKGGKYLCDTHIFDLYSGQGIEEGKRSLAFRLYFQSDERTLKDSEVDDHVRRVTKELSRRYEARWRQS
ncbi:MAG: phenylalanine--tRNA ligase subunit beta [Fidelibacterota bacterium]|nr:MAG: phenylalanine--tRNA ligase subunit beta [Candidatus Neomarinimicrobiota bacterium]